MSDDDPDLSSNGQTESGLEQDNEECFVIAPIGDPRTETRRQTDGLLNEAIRPVIEEQFGLDVVAAHELPEAGSITRQVIQRLLEAELVVADLTGLNANVMYELAVRHAKGRPVVPIAEKGTSLPFDITTERTVFYEESFQGLSNLKPKLEDAAQAALRDEEPDNPIHRAQQDFKMREAVAGDSEMEYVLDRLDDIKSILSQTESSVEEGESRKNPPTEYYSDLNGDLESVVEFENELHKVLPQSVTCEVGRNGMLTLRVADGELTTAQDARAVAQEVGEQFGIEIGPPLPF